MTAKEPAIAIHWEISNHKLSKRKTGFTGGDPSESGWRVDQDGMDSAFSQCSEWTHFFASLKARLEHGVDLKDFFCDSAMS